MCHLLLPVLLQALRFVGREKLTLGAGVCADCVIDNVVPPEMIPELQAEADRLNDDQSLHDPTAYYQGTHIGVRFDENPVMERLANLPQARAAAEAIGMGDMQHGGGMIVLTKEAAGKKAAAPLYWHHVRRFCPARRSWSR